MLHDWIEMRLGVVYRRRAPTCDLAMQLVRFINQRLLPAAPWRLFLVVLLVVELKTLQVFCLLPGPLLAIWAGVPIRNKENSIDEICKILSISRTTL